LIKKRKAAFNFMIILAFFVIVRPFLLHVKVKTFSLRGVVRKEKSDKQRSRLSC